MAKQRGSGPTACERYVTSRTDLVRYWAVRAERRAARELRAALAEAIEGYEYACEYKGDYFVKKHGDKEAIAKCRAVLARYAETDEKGKV